jgi:hypothetical protein
MHMTTHHRFCRGVRPSPLVLAAAITAALLTSAACSEQGAAQMPADSPIVLSTQQIMITVQNKAGMPLNTAKLTVVAFGNTEFSKTFSRLENGETREVLLTDLYSRDGTPYNARLSKPKTVRLTATDATGKEYTVETPWK